MDRITQVNSRRVNHSVQPQAQEFDTRQTESKSNCSVRPTEAQDLTHLSVVSMKSLAPSLPAEIRERPIGHETPLNIKLDRTKEPSPRNSKSAGYCIEPGGSATVAALHASRIATAKMGRSSRKQSWLARR